jgi:fucose permease
MVFTALILSGITQTSSTALAAMDISARAAFRADLANRLVTPYIVMAVGLILFMLIIHFSSLTEPELDAEGDSSQETTRFGVLRFPQLVLGAITLFAYVGVEVIAGDTIGLYGHHLGVQNYAALTSYTMGFMVLGYLLGAFTIPRFLSQKNALALCAVSGIVFAFGVMYASSTEQKISQVVLAWAGVPTVPNTVLFLAMLGFSNALVWPAVWPLALEGLGRYTAAGSAVLIMGISGGAILPLAYGHFSDHGGAQQAYWVMLPCYALILLYALKGHTLRHWTSTSK